MDEQWTPDLPRNRQGKIEVTLEQLEDPAIRARMLRPEMMERARQLNAEQAWGHYLAKLEAEGKSA